MRNDPDKKCLYINDLLQYLLQSNINLLVNDQNCETKADIILCGMWRIRKNHKTKRFSYQRLKLTYSNGQFDATWVKTTKIFSLPLFNFYDKSDFFFDNIFSWCFKAILTDLKDTLTLQHSLKHSRTYNLAESSDRQHIATNIGERLFFHIPIKSKNKAMRQLVKKTWPLLNDRNLVDVYRKIFHLPQSLDGESPLSAIGLGEINKFEKHGLSASDALEHKSILPLLQFIEPSHYRNKTLFSNKVLLNLLAQKGVHLTKGDLKILKLQPITFTKRFCYELNNLMYLKANNIIKENNSHLLKGFLRSPLLMNSPLRVKCTFLGEYSRSIGYAPLSLTILEKWAIYHQPMFKALKPIKHTEQWERLIFKCLHVVDWYSRTMPQLHKNQTWTSFSKLADAWTRHQHELENVELEEMHWEKSLPEDIHVAEDNQEILISEIDNALNLNKEGEELDHCVFNYRFDCLERRYHVFSIKALTDGEIIERATLGLHVNTQTGKLEFDQLRSFDNGSTSKRFKTLSMKLIRDLNSKEHMTVA